MQLQTFCVNVLLSDARTRSVHDNVPTQSVGTIDAMKF